MNHVVGVGEKRNPRGQTRGFFFRNTALALLHTGIYTVLMKKMKTPREKGFDRILVTLPKPLIGELRDFSQLFRQGNKSGFVADAISNYIDYLRKVRHTAKLREATLLLPRTVSG